MNIQGQEPPVVADKTGDTDRDDQLNQPVVHKSTAVGIESIPPVAFAPMQVRTAETGLLAAASARRVICDKEYITDLSGSTCKTSNLHRANLCWSHSNTVVVVSFGHEGQWSSSRRCKEMNGYPFFLNTLLLASSLFLSGNNYANICLFSRFKPSLHF